MKKLIFTHLLLGILCTASFAQTKIGGTPGAANANAYLELDASGTPKKGLLHSRVALTATTNATPLTAHVVGMMVYNTATAGDVTPGIYYNDGTKWVRSSAGDQFTTIEYGSGAPSSTCTSGTLYTDTLSASPTLGQQWTCSGGSWASYVAPAGTEWYLTGTTNDAGADKGSHIYRNNAISIRNTAVNSNSTLAPGALELYRFSDPAASFPTNGYIDFKDKLTDDYDFRISYNSSIGTKGALVFAPTTDGTPITSRNNAVVINNANGHVGLGTQKFDGRTNLHVVNSEYAYGRNLARFSNFASGDSSWLAIGTGSELGDYNPLTTAGDARIIFSTDNNGLEIAERGLLIAPHYGVVTDPVLRGVKIMESGYVGIGVASPMAGLQVREAITSNRGYRTKAGTAAAIGGNIFNINWSSSVAQLWIDGTNLGNISITSDYRLKKNVSNMDNSALARVRKLRPVSFEYKDMDQTIFKSDNVKHEGFVAHELKEVIPSAVNGEKDAVTVEGNIQPQTLNPMPVISLLTKAVQEQLTLIEAQQKKIEELEARIDAQQVMIGKASKKGKNSRKVAYTKQR